MNTIIHPLNPASPSTRSPDATANALAARKPHYDCREQGDALQVVVYVPGVDASGVEITTRGPDLTVTARKTHFVRVNWQSLHLEGAQRDYQLRLRLGHGLDYTALQAEIQDGVLTLTLPKKQPETFAATRDRLRKVA
ncbi:MAG: Hsp20/alpha crystallin family protein [Opitutaceae bacterium]|jgi:HSP20 family molecular chaperone IbpA